MKNIKMPTLHLPRALGLPQAPRPEDPWFNFWFFWAVMFGALFLNNASGVHPFVAPLVGVVFFLSACFMVGETDGK